MSPKSEVSAGGMILEGVNGLDESIAPGDSLMGAWMMESVVSCESSSLRREPPRRGAGAAGGRVWAPSLCSAGLKSWKVVSLRMGDGGKMARWRAAGRCDKLGPLNLRGGCRCWTPNGGREVIAGRRSDAPYRTIFEML